MKEIHSFRLSNNNFLLNYMVQIGEKAVDMLMSRISDPGRTVPETVQLGVHLAERQSVKDLNNPII